LISVIYELLSSSLILYKYNFVDSKDVILDDWIRIVLAWTLLFNLAVIMKLMRGLDDFSWLVRTILQNLSDITSFMFVMCIFCIYFGYIQFVI